MLSVSTKTENMIPFLCSQFSDLFKNYVYPEFFKIGRLTLDCDVVENHFVVGQLMEVKGHSPQLSNGHTPWSNNVEANQLAEGSYSLGLVVTVIQV